MGTSTRSKGYLPSFLLRLRSRLLIAGRKRLKPFSFPRARPNSTFLNPFLFLQTLKFELKRLQ